jgi:prevent-host-death family protein
MKNVGLFEAKQKLSELVERASSGEKIGITRRGRLSALLAPASPGADLQEVFARIEGIRKTAKPFPRV